MAIDFDGSESNTLQVAIPSPPAYPIYIGCRVRHRSGLATTDLRFTDVACPATIERTTSAGANGNGIGPLIYTFRPYVFAAQGAGSSAVGGNLPVIGYPMWDTILILANSTTDRKLYVNGVLAATDTTSMSVDLSAGAPAVTVGSRSIPGSGQAMRGEVADVILGHGTPTSTDFTTYNTIGASLTGLTGILNWWKLDGNGNDEIGGLTLVSTGGTPNWTSAPATRPTVTRAGYVAQVFSGNGIPSASPTITTGVASPLSNATGYASVERFDVTYSCPSFTWNTTGSYNTCLWHFIPSSPRSPSHVVFFDDGHGQLSVINNTTINPGSGGVAHINALLADGYGVVLGMPPGYNPNDSDYPTDHHDDYWNYYNPGTFNPLALWLAPPLIALNNLAGRYTKRSTNGLSGGGWQTMRIAALDLRINHAMVCMRGSIAHARMTNHQYDFEQYAKPNGFTNEEIWRMVASGNRRLWMLHHETDSCCFGKLAPDLTVTGPSAGSYLDATAYDATFLAPIRAATGADVRMLVSPNAGESYHAIYPTFETSETLTALSTALPSVFRPWSGFVSGAGLSGAGFNSGGRF